VATLKVRVVPRAGRTAIAGRRGDALLVRLAAAPVDGDANDALVAFIADVLDCPRRDVEIATGQRRRDKLLRIASLTEADLARRVDLLVDRS
jgi:uncharacterized protein